MLKRSIIIILFLSISATLQAQLSYGLKAGLNVSRMLIRNDTMKTALGFSPSFHVGVYGSVDISDKLAFSADFLISDKGWKERSAVHFLYASIPVLAHFKPIGNLSIGVGPSLGLLITQWGKDRELVKEIYNNRFDFAAVGSIQYSITPSIALALRVEQGLSNVIGKDARSTSYIFNPDGDPLIVRTKLRREGFKARNQSFQLSVCYRL